MDSHKNLRYFLKCKKVFHSPKDDPQLSGKAFPNLMVYITSILTFAPYLKPTSIKERRKYTNAIPSCKK